MARFMSFWDFLSDVGQIVFLVWFCLGLSWVAWCEKRYLGILASLVFGAWFIIYGLFVISLRTGRPEWRVGLVMIAGMALGVATIRPVSRFYLTGWMLFLTALMGKRGNRDD